MAEFETAITDAIAAHEIPGCALIAANRNGSSFKYAEAFGATSMKEGNAKPFDLNTVMWVASCTKLMTSISAMQLVERGLVTLDEPIYKHIPELEKLKVLTGFDQSTGAPIEEKQTVPMTLRHLLTHASGLSYDGMHPKLLAWLAYHKKQPNQSGKLLERFTAPLVAQPGESWAYGSSIDYVGLLVERLSGKSLEEYLKENLWEPLGIKDMTFYLSKRPDMKARLADMSTRSEEGKVRFTEGRLPYVDGDGNEVEDCMGGQGCFTSAEEYVKVLQAILTTDENEKILKKASVEEFFKPQLGEGSSGMLNMMLQDDMVNNAMGGTSKSVKKDWGLGGILIVGSSDDSKFEPGTMLWGGYPNLIWWADRKAGLTGLYASQIVPPGDAKSAQLTSIFQEGMYKAMQKVSTSSPRL